MHTAHNAKWFRQKLQQASPAVKSREKGRECRNAPIAVKRLDNLILRGSY